MENKDSLICSFEESKKKLAGQIRFVNNISEYERMIQLWKTELLNCKYNNRIALPDFESKVNSEIELLSKKVFELQMKQANEFFEKKKKAYFIMIEPFRNSPENKREKVLSQMDEAKMQMDKFFPLKLNNKGGFTLDYEFNELYFHFLENELKLLSEIEVIPEKGVKIKWKSSPSVLGFIFLELAKKGFIELPVKNGESNFSELARIVQNFFDIEGTPESIEKAFRESSNKLSKAKRGKFGFPEKTDLE